VAGCDFNGIFSNVEVHKVGEEGVVGESIDSWSPSIRMLGFQDRLDGVA
jgi:hypothetical protein